MDNIDYLLLMIKQYFDLSNVKRRYRYVDVAACIYVI